MRRPGVAMQISTPRNDQHKTGKAHSNFFKLKNNQILIAKQRPESKAESHLLSNIHILRAQELAYPSQGP